MRRDFPTRRKSIFFKLFIPIMGVLMVQTIIFVLSFVMGGVLSSVTASSYDILNQQVANRTLYVENEMIHRWSSLAESETLALSTVKSILAENGADVSSIAYDTKLNEEILSELTDDLIYTLRKNAVTGIYVILDGAGDGDPVSRASLYIRHLDPTSYSPDNADLLFERGLPSVAREYNISLNSFWQTGMAFMDDGNPNEDFFFKPVLAVKSALADGSITPESDSICENFGYWSGSMRLNKYDHQSVTYSIPLVYGDGTVIGVLGVEISHSYLISLLKDSELSAGGAYSYVLATTEDGAHFNRVLSQGPVYSLGFGASDSFAALPQGYQNIYAFDSYSDPDYQQFLSTDASVNQLTPIMGSVNYLSLYNDNTPFVSQKWALIGMLRSSDLYAPVNGLRNIIYACAIFAVAMGLIAVYFASRVLSNPITSIVTELKKSDPNKPITLKKIGIEEIDQLTTSIESLSHRVCENASRLSRIISMTNVPVAVFEHLKAEKTVLCSRNLFSMLDWQPGFDLPSEGSNVYVPYMVFFDYFYSMKNKLYDSAQSIYHFNYPDRPGRWIKITFHDDPHVRLGVITDITYEFEEKQRVEQERDYDTLTYLLNRRAFSSRMDLLFARPNALGVGALIMWDLDNLKYLNDSFGHDFGDLYLKALAECLADVDGPNGIASRRSGDEFYTFMYGYSSEDEVRDVVLKLWNTIDSRCILLPNGQQFKIRVSAGMSWFPQDSTDYNELIRFADFAMYSVKHSVKGNIREFSKETYDDSGFLINAQGALNQLLDQELISYALQPIIAVKDSSLYGYEMLMRPQIKELSTPVEVLRIASSQSKLHQIERLSWFNSMETFVELTKQGKIADGTKVFINSVGSHMMTTKDVILFETRFGSYLSQIVLELTENEQSNPLFTKAKLGYLDKWHALLAVDDYGAGYSNDSALLSTSPDIVKVDISIVRGVDKDINRQNILENLISYATKRGIKVLAEGVETEEEMAFLISRGIDFLQGFYLGRPNLEATPVAQEVLDQVTYYRRLREDLTISPEHF